MTARINPSVRATGDRPPVDEFAVAQAELAKVRADVDNLRRLVAEGRVPASALSTAQYRVQGALRRLDALGWQPPPVPQDAAWGAGDDAA